MYPASVLEWRPADRFLCRRAEKQVKKTMKVAKKRRIMAARMVHMPTV